MENKDFVLGKLTFIEQVASDKYFHKRAKYLCFCGKEFIATIQHIKTGNTKSCGCYGNHVTKIAGETHGFCKTSLHKVWCGMKNRCGEKGHKNYGERGIIVCKKWKNDFLTFKEWVEKSGYKKGLSIDRINVNGNYTPSNCRWVDAKIQRINQRPKTNKTGYPGVSFRPNNSANPYSAKICIDQEDIHLGYFKTLKEASDTYESNKKERDKNYLKRFNKNKK